MQNKRNFQKIAWLVSAGFAAAVYGVTITTPPIAMSGKVVQQPEYVEVDRTGYKPVVIQTEPVRMQGMSR